MTIQVVAAPSGVPVTNLASAAADDLSTAVMLCTPRAGLTDAGISIEMLAALGKDQQVQGRARHAFDTVFLAPLWLLAHRVQHLIALSAQSWSDGALLTCADLAACSGTTITFACDDGYLDRIADAVRSYCPVKIAWPGAAHGPPGPKNEPGDRASGWDPNVPNSLPATSFFTFRADCRRLLTPDHFQRVDARYINTVNHVRGHFQDAVITEDATLALLTCLIADCGTKDDATITMRAAQAALLPLGWLLKYEQGQLMQTLTHHRLPNLTTTEWRMLRAYSDPSRPATVAMYLGGIKPADMLDITVGEVAAAYENRPGAPLRNATLADEAWPYMRAQLLVRATDAVAPDAPFLLAARSSKDRGINSNRRARLDLRQAATDLGLNLGEGRLSDRDTVDDRWARRLGFTVQAIT